MRGSKENRSKPRKDDPRAAFVDCPAKPQKYGDHTGYEADSRDDAVH